MLHTFRLWVPLGVTITLLCGLMYGVVQQNYRQNANDPQIQIAGDVAQSIERGETYAQYIYPSTVNIATSLAPFVIVYDANGKVLFSNGTFDGATPAPPQGVFDYTKAHGQDRLTWAPRPDIRLATVVNATKDGGYVLVARSLAEVEKRENMLTENIALGWAVTMIFSFASVLFFVPLKKGK